MQGFLAQLWLLISYQSSDPSQPAMFHDNICARDEHEFDGYGAPCTHPVGHRVHRNVKVQTRVSWQHVQNLQIESLGFLAVAESAQDAV